MRFFRASSRSPSSGSSRQCLDPVKNDCIYHQSRRLPSCTGGRPPVQECAGSHRRYWPTRMRAIGLPGQRGAASKVASNVGASTASWAQACTRLPATAAGCNGMLPATFCLLRGDSLSAARWADAGAPFSSLGRSWTSALRVGAVSDHLRLQHRALEHTPVCGQKP